MGRRVRVPGLCATRVVGLGRRVEAAAETRVTPSPTAMSAPSQNGAGAPPGRPLPPAVLAQRWVLPWLPPVPRASVGPQGRRSRRRSGMQLDQIKRVPGSIVGITASDRPYSSHLSQKATQRDFGAGRAAR